MKLKNISVSTSCMFLVFFFGGVSITSFVFYVGFTQHPDFFEVRYMEFDLPAGPSTAGVTTSHREPVCQRLGRDRTPQSNPGIPWKPLHHSKHPPVTAQHQISGQPIRHSLQIQAPGTEGQTRRDGKRESGEI